jgi:hypothetical protein
MRENIRSENNLKLENALLSSTSAESGATISSPADRSQNNGTHSNLPTITLRQHRTDAGS